MLVKRITVRLNQKLFNWLQGISENNVSKIVREALELYKTKLVKTVKNQKGINNGNE